MKLFKSTSLLLTLGAIDQALAAYKDTDKISGVTTIAFEYYKTEAECKAGTPLIKHGFEHPGTGCMPQSSKPGSTAPTMKMYLSPATGTATSFKRDVFTDNACATKDAGSSQTWLFTCEKPKGETTWRKKSTKTAGTVWYDTYTDKTCTTKDGMGYTGYIKDGCTIMDPGNDDRSQKWAIAGGKLTVKTYKTSDCTGTAGGGDIVLKSDTCTGSVAGWGKNFQADNAGGSSGGSSAAAGGATLAAAAAATCLFVHAAALFL